MEFNFIRNFDESALTADIYVYSEIGGDYGISGQAFANEINWLVKNTGIKTLNIRINSPGGDVMEAYSMFMAINKCGIKTCAFIDGIAASCAGWIALAANEIRMAPHGKIMIHAPYNPDGDINENDRVALEAIKDQIMTIFENRTGMTRGMIEGMMQGNTWLNASECIEMKIADGLDAYTPRSMPMNTLKQVLNKQITETNMKEVKNHSETATDVEVFAKVKELTTERDQYKNKAEAAEKRVDELNGIVAENEVDKAIAEGKFPATERENLVTQAQNNLDAFRSLVASVAPARGSVSAEIAKNKGTGTDEDRSGWNFKDWLIKDRSGLKKMEAENNAEFIKLRDAYNPKEK